MWLKHTQCNGAGNSKNVWQIRSKLWNQRVGSLNLLGGTILPRFLFRKRYVSGAVCWLPVPVFVIVGRQLMTIKWAIRQYNINIQRFEQDMVSIRSRWQGRYGAWLIDTPPQMVGLTTDSLQCNTTVITPPWPSVSKSVLRVKLGVTIFCILALPRVTLRVTTKEVKWCGDQVTTEDDNNQSSLHCAVMLLKKHYVKWNYRTTQPICSTW